MRSRAQIEQETIDAAGLHCKEDRLLHLDWLHIAPALHIRKKNEDAVIIVARTGVNLFPNMLEAEE